MKVYISLTTIPSRIKGIGKTIDSLINQSVKPTRIFLNIPVKYNLRFNNAVKDSDIPKFDDSIVEVVRCSHDYGPGTKLMGNVDFLKRETDAIVILVDDDFGYDKELVKKSLKVIEKNKNVGTTGSYRKILNYSFGGAWKSFAFSTHLLSRIRDFYNLIRNNRQILHHDDYWISFYLHYAGLKKIEPLNISAKSIQSEINALSLISDKVYKRGTLNRICFEYFTSENFLESMNKIYKLNKKVVETTPTMNLVTVSNYKGTSGKPLRLKRAWEGPSIYTMC